MTSSSVCSCKSISASSSSLHIEILAHRQVRAEQANHAQHAYSGGDVQKRREREVDARQYAAQKRFDARRSIAEQTVEAGGADQAAEQAFAEPFDPERHAHVAMGRADQLQDFDLDAAGEYGQPNGGADEIEATDADQNQR